MTIRLTSEQEALARKAVEAGAVSSVEEFISAAILALDLDVNTTAEAFLGLSTDELRTAIQDGLNSGEAQPWEGMDHFNARMRKAYRDRPDAEHP